LSIKQPKQDEITIDELTCPNLLEAFYPTTNKQHFGGGQKSSKNIQKNVPSLGWTRIFDAIWTLKMLIKLDKKIA